MVSEHLWFVTERIMDILELEEEREVEYSDDERIKKQRMTKSLQDLHKELSWIVDYLKHVESRSDEQHHDHDRVYLEIRDIANSSDEILNLVNSNDVVNETYDSNETVSFLNHLVDRIRNFHYLLSSKNYISEWGSTKIDSSHSRAPMITRPKSYAHVPNHDFVGFKQEIQTLLHHLTQDSDTRVLGIVGRGGSGKTTLAKHIYHHPHIKTKFPLKIWVCISQCWDQNSILNDIWWQAAQGRKANEMNYDQLVHRLYGLLSLQQYLVILDDIWSVNAWHFISPCLPCNSRSKVMVTTRNKAIPEMIGPIVHIVEPKPLDYEESWELFKRRAFLLIENTSDGLLPLGMEMVKKCNGLPLAIVALAGVLRMDKREISWQRVSMTLTYNILKANDHSTHGLVKEILAMSYNELPHQLKQCVLYLRFFPEDYEINARNLIQMWIAEGLINTYYEVQESTAQEYLEEIVERYIVEVVKTNFMGQVSRIRISDLTRQMLVHLNKERGFLTDSLRLDSSAGFLTNLLRLDSSAILYGDERNHNFPSMSKLECIANVERIFHLETSSHIRSVIFLNSLDLSKSILQLMFVKFRLLRVLILHDIHIIPEEIGNLIHLRYFELTGVVEQFPGLIGNLRNLRTLNIRQLNCEGEVEMNLCKLKELRHLYLSDNFLEPTNMGKLKLGRLEKLKTLWNVAGGEWMLLGMTRLNVFLEELSVYCISTEEQLEVVFKTPSITSNNLQTLKLSWDTVKWRDMNILRECKSLKNLMLDGLIQAGTDLMFPPNLIKLEMSHMYVKEREVMNIISESCPHLEILKFSFDAFVGEELVCNANSFPKLVKLKLYHLGFLRQWIIESTAMPSLHYLTIYDCQKLTLTPEGRSRILQIPQLTIIDFPHL